MKLNHLTEIHEFLQNNPTFLDVVSGLRKNKPQKIISNYSAYAYIISTLRETLGVPTVVITSNPEESLQILDGINFWSNSTSNLHFSERNEIFLEKYKPDNKNSINRMRCLEGLFTGMFQKKPPIICTSVQAIGTKTLEKKYFEKLLISLEKGSKINQKEFINNLIKSGYKNTSIVESVGEFAQRGDIVDVFCLSEKDPIRIDFFYDEIETLKLFETSTQKSYKNLEKITISPIKETYVFDSLEEVKNYNKKYIDNLDKDNKTKLNNEIESIQNGSSEELINFYSGFFDRGTIFEYIHEDTLVVKLDDYNIDFELKEIEVKRKENYSEKINKKIISDNFPTPYVSKSIINDFFKKNNFSVNLNQRKSQNDTTNKIEFSIPKILDFSKDNVYRYIDTKNKNEKIIISTDYPSRVKEILRSENIKIFENINSFSNDKINIISKNAGTGFRLNDNNNSLLLLTDKEIFGRNKKRTYKSYSNNIPSNISSEPFKLGDNVVHIDHGVGKFIGTTQMGSSDKEFIVINYKNDDKLYVPSDQIDRIQVYKSFQKEDPKLDTLGSNKWIKTKNKVKKSIEILAGELLQIYATREKIKGKSFSKTTEWYQVLEESFEFEETIDQVKSINEITKDLKSKTPMDRLLCGDVGFGKTEVALRSAFRVVENGFQVAILVPTTVLALQHYKTFKERLDPFPIEIAYMSRFVSNKKNNQILSKLNEGKIDIVIGTHKLLNEKIKFDKLGLLIIDEEHKFGVEQKEKIKKREIDVDILSLSATPIPRTLSLALNGVRDLSVINTPPENRIPVNNYLSVFSEDLLREGILREIERQGQVFFVNNEVFNIEIISNQIKKIVPEAKIAIAHGQMEKKELEEVITNFMENKFNVLVCTTIIESGIDMPNVNTLFINNSQKFGLSQLYQMRGRIGRSEKSSYAYFLLPKSSRINEVSEERLNALINSSEFQSGYDIALRDLEIRGAGNILGKEQSGNISSIGLELYNSLLESAVDSMKNGKEEILDFFLINTVDIDIDSRIPEDYIDDIKIRLNLYMRLSKIREINQIYEIKEEIIDRFGEPPEELERLLILTQIKILCHESNNILSIAGNSDILNIKFKDSLLDIKFYLEKNLIENIEIKSKTMSFIPENSENILSELVILINKIIKIQDEIKTKFEEISSNINNN
ncbi:MAG: transcription-repair coupling factor [Dehalococcoidia bacterium]|nr:transcription-repair coupling factor [Dehalococcoidia bacterium]